MSGRIPNNRDLGMIEARRERVAAMALRGFTAREIVIGLASGDHAMLNAKTGRPFALGTIGHDMAVLRDRWKEAANADYADAKARHLAEIGALKRAAWAVSDLAAVARALDREAKVWGFDAPVKHEVTGAEGAPIEVKHEFADDQLADILRILAGTGALQPGTAAGVDSKTE